MDNICREWHKAIQGAAARMTAADEDARPHAIGVSIHADQLTGVIIDLDGEPVRLGGGAAEPDAMIRALRETTPEAVVHDLAALWDELLRMAAANLGGPVVGLGVAVGGHVVAGTGLVLFSPNLGWKGVPLGPMLMQATKIEAVDVENDTKILAVAEQLFGHGVGRPSFAVVKVRTGISCGLVLDHELYRGVTGLAGELGHLVFEPGGNPCRCGRRGCLEAIASRDAMLGAVRAAGQPNLTTIDELADLADQRDHVAMAAIERAGEALGRGLAMLLNLLNLDLVVLYAEEPLVETPAYLEAVRASLAAHAFSSAASDCRIIPKVLTEVLEARAAASMAFSRFYPT